MITPFYKYTIKNFIRPQKFPHQNIHKEKHFISNKQRNIYFFHEFEKISLGHYLNLRENKERHIPFFNESAFFICERKKTVHKPPKKG